MRTDLLLLAPIGVSLALYALTMGASLPPLLRRAPSRPIHRAPRVTILKPVAGVDEDLIANLASFAAIDFPSFELLLGVASPDDPAVPVLREFLARHAGLDARLIVTNPDAAANPKVAQLIGLERLATGHVLVISDANVRVAPDYLFQLVAELEGDGVGLVTSVIAGTGERSIGAALENLQLGAFIAPSVVGAARLLPSRPLAVGKSMAMRRRDLRRVGGFESVGHLLAEDNILGQRFAREGFAVRVSLARVENRNVSCSSRRTFDRHTRWTQMRRAMAPAAFVFEPLLTPFVVALLSFALAPTRLLAGVLLATAIAQVLGAQLALYACRGKALAWAWAPLELVRSLMAFACWLRACATRRVMWRGHPFRIGAETAITPIVAARRRSTATARA